MAETLREISNQVFDVLGEWERVLGALEEPLSQDEEPDDGVIPDRPSDLIEPS